MNTMNLGITSLMYCFPLL